MAYLALPPPNNIKEYFTPIRKSKFCPRECSRMRTQKIALKKDKPCTIAALTCHLTARRWVS